MSWSSLYPNVRVPTRSGFKMQPRWYVPAEIETPRESLERELEERGFEVPAGEDPVRYFLDTREKKESKFPVWVIPVGLAALLFTLNR